MPQRIELSFSTNLTPPPPLPPGAGTRIAGCGEDTAVDDTQSTAENEARLREMQVGKHTVSEVVKNLGVVLGHDLYPAKVLQDGEITKVFLEQGNTESKIYDITDGGLVHTSQVRHPNVSHGSEDHMFVQFKTTFTKAPSVMVGLNFLDAARNENVRIEGTAQQIYDHAFEVQSKSWANTIIHGAGFTWFAVPSYANSLFQIGSFSTGQDHAWDVRKNETNRVITFPTPYKTAPKVVVWLNCIDTKHGYGDRVIAYASHITPKSFKVHLNTWGETWLHLAAVSWFAYPADTPGIRSGYFEPPNGTSGILTFDKPFKIPPRRVLMALTKLDIDKNGYCRIKLIHEAVSARGMFVKFETWLESKIYSAAVAYIAME